MSGGGVPPPFPGGAAVEGPARDLTDYGDRYVDLPFEPLQVRFRRRRVLARVRSAAPRRLLEVGCAELPLFVDLPEVTCVVVEPTARFAGLARELAAGRETVAVVEAFAEDLVVDDVGGPFDMVVLSGLLHEVPDPQRLLAAARAACAPGGRMHVNVPAAGSLHRLLAVAMGLISDPADRSATQRLLQQPRVYDAAGLDRELERAGFRVVDRGSILVKPFTHAQMQRLVDEGFLTEQMLEGLDRLTDVLPELGSEIWVDAEPADA